MELWILYIDSDREDFDKFKSLVSRRISSRFTSTTFRIVYASSPQEGLDILSKDSGNIALICLDPSVDTIQGFHNGNFKLIEDEFEPYIGGDHSLLVYMGSPDQVDKVLNALTRKKDSRRIIQDSDSESLIKLLGELVSKRSNGGNSETMRLEVRVTRQMSILEAQVGKLSDEIVNIKNAFYLSDGKEDAAVVQIRKSTQFQEEMKHTLIAINNTLRDLNDWKDAVEHRNKNYDKLFKDFRKFVWRGIGALVTIMLGREGLEFVWDWVSEFLGLLGDD
jgi:hypothetical protein